MGPVAPESQCLGRGGGAAATRHPWAEGYRVHSPGALQAGRLLSRATPVVGSQSRLPMARTACGTGPCPLPPRAAEVPLRAADSLSPAPCAAPTVTAGHNEHRYKIS